MDNKYAAVLLKADYCCNFEHLIECPRGNLDYMAIDFFLQERLGKRDSMDRRFVFRSNSYTAVDGALLDVIPWVGLNQFYLEAQKIE